MEWISEYVEKNIYQTVKTEQNDKKKIILKKEEKKPQERKQKSTQNIACHKSLTGLGTQIEMMKVQAKLGLLSLFRHEVRTTFLILSFYQVIFIKVGKGSGRVFDNH